MNDLGLWCRDCGCRKPVRDFPRSLNHTGKFSTRCRACWKQVRSPPPVLPRCQVAGCARKCLHPDVRWCGDHAPRFDRVVAA